MLPEGIPTVTVTGRYLRPNGTPLTGQVVFRAPALITFADHDVILGGPVTAPLNAQGAFEVVLPATDAPGMNPTGWSYAVAEQFATVTQPRTYQILLPAATPTVDIADIAPTDPTTPNYVAVNGKSAYQVAVDGGFTGTEQQWLDSLVGPVGPAGSVTAVNTIAPDAGGNVTVTAADVDAVDVAEKGAASGVATLGTDGILAASQRPARAASRSAVITAAAAGSWAVWQAPRPVTITGVRAHRTGGTAATVNAARAGADLLATDLSLTTADTWLTGTGLQNTAVAAGDSLSVAVRSASSTPTVTIQIDYEEV